MTINLKVTSTVSLSIGNTMANIVGDINAHTENLFSGDIPCDLFWFIDEAACDAGKDQISPVVNNVKIAACTITLTQAEIVAANLPLTIFTKVAAKLSTDYGWTVIVE